MKSAGETFDDDLRRTTRKSLQRSVFAPPPLVDKEAEGVADQRYRSTSQHVQEHYKKQQQEQTDEAQIEQEQYKKSMRTLVKLRQEVPQQVAETTHRVLGKTTAVLQAELDAIQAQSEENEARWRAIMNPDENEKRRVEERALRRLAADDCEFDSSGLASKDIADAYRQYHAERKSEREKTCAEIERSEAKSERLDATVRLAAEIKAGKWRSLTDCDTPIPEYMLARLPNYRRNGEGDAAKK